MKTRIWIWTGDRPSNGAKELAAQEGFLRLRQGNFHKIRPTDIVINWGTTVTITNDAIKPNVNHAKVVNFPMFVKAATDKLQAFREFTDGLDDEGGVAPTIKTVEWTTDQAIAQSWSDNEFTVVVRNKLTGHSGDGIVIIDKLQPVPKAPLYTKYVFKVKEFRVHVVNGKVIDTQQKIKDPDRKVVSWKVRSHDNGFIFARNGIVDNADRDALAIAATKALGLDFGAVDIIQDKKGILYVLECNTAPGLEGQTVDSYTEAFRKYANGN